MLMFKLMDESILISSALNYTDLIELLIISRLDNNHTIFPGYGSAYDDRHIHSPKVYSKCDRKTP